VAWSSFAHLPTTEDEYWYILSNLRNGMSCNDVDTIIADYKGKDKVQHHYRSNLLKLGFFYINQNFITLNYDAKKLADNKKNLKHLLTVVINENQTAEIKKVTSVVLKIKSYDLQQIVNILNAEYPLIEQKSFKRWVRPIVLLLKFADILANKIVHQSHYVRYLQDAFLKITNEFGSSAPLELVENELKKVDASLNIVGLLDKVLEDFDKRFKIELLMMPSWATKNKSYKINQDMYTHIKIKSDLLGED
jgi:hypothetical protein